ncbi:hypothetical protein QAD02_010624 [Eretmocerus hayati]|uniref:Uncharacterized protein n=1 Tax=Eretmocerus hayati TaxID=131215 RepID=A0ACC2NVE5_9HYME|nr:hypothetical protein QAD02_010624 [Eretmocerus hayati]
MEDRIASICLEKYAMLKKTGKPTENEWTVLSGVVLQNIYEDLSVVALCTGTKCLSGKELNSPNIIDRGDRLSDSHAEVLARRAFLRFLYDQIELLLKSGDSDVFYMEDKKIRLKDISFHFFSSQTPCGDCSIIPKLQLRTDRKRPKLDNEPIQESDFGAIITDIYRTGAKCLVNDERQDSQQKGADYHITGPIRTKPGRGDRTQSLSCSDKIARWNVLGAQGALLSLMIPSIRFESITIGGGCPYSSESMNRGIYMRFDPKIQGPVIKQSKISFDCKKSHSRTRPCPTSIVWCAVLEKEVEIAVNGFRQGMTKKKIKSRRLAISRKEIFKTFLKVSHLYSELRNESLSNHPKKIYYHDCKQYALSYQNTWRDYLTTFRNWPLKNRDLYECLSF